MDMLYGPLVPPMVKIKEKDSLELVTVIIILYSHYIS